MRIDELPGIGPVRAKAFHSVGIVSAEDLLLRAPVGIEPPAIDIDRTEARDGAAVTCVATVSRVASAFLRGRGRVTTATLERMNGATFTARFWRAPWAALRLLPGSRWRFTGRISNGILAQPSLQDAEQPAEQTPTMRYRCPEGIGERVYAQALAQALTTCLPTLVDPLCNDTAAFQQALRTVHEATTSESTREQARRLLAVRELTALAWRMRDRRAARQTRTRRVIDSTWIERLPARLPYALTPGQITAWREVFADLAAAQPMERLLHGEVGSGKTSIAALAALTIAHHGEQVALLAPTAPLAVQLHRVIAALATPLGIDCRLLLGGMAPDARRSCLDALASGTCGIVIGTHALLDADVRFARLGLVIIDEQQRFGVAQRTSLVQRAASPPDVLLLSATPIPRTLALTAYGDLSVSLLRDVPPNRAPVTTSLMSCATATALPKALSPLREPGACGMIVCARKADDAHVFGIPQVLTAAKRVLNSTRIRSITGEANDADKHDAIAALQDGRIDWLVATSIIEVGIDVPRATHLVILDGERFGLAQLHQLRGRLGRGSAPGACWIAHRSDPPPERLLRIAESRDGFALAEHDLAERGPGALLGDDQHGDDLLRIARLPGDLDLIQAAHAYVATQHTACPAALHAWCPGATHWLDGG